MNEQILALDKERFIRNQRCFSQLTQDEINELSDLFNEVTFKKGSVIVSKGDQVDSVYIIIQGEVDVRDSVVKDNKIEEFSVAKLSGGNAIGLNDTGFYSLSGRRTATVVALSDEVKLLRLSVAAFHGFALDHTHVTEVMRRYAHERTLEEARRPTP